MRYQLKLLGTFVIEPHDTANNPKQLNRKTRAILAYVVATGQPQPRRTLYQWFCQGTKDPAGTLRWHLSQIRRKVGADLLHVTRQEVWLNQEQVQCDHLRFESVLNHLPSCSLAELADAVALYRGSFLSDLWLKNAPEFELWLLGENGRFQTLYQKGATTLISRYIQQNQLSQAIPIAQNLLQTNPLLENAHRHLIWLYAQTGQRETALHQFEQCRALLWQELAVEPSDALLALHDAIQHNQPLPNIHPETQSSTRQQNKTQQEIQDTNFIGRAPELAQLQQQWQNGRTVTLINAPAGGGKTELVQQFSHTITARQLHGNCYESTRNMPYYPWLTILEQHVTTLDEAALAQLAPQWRQQLGLLLPQLGATAVSPNQQQLFRAITYLLTGLDEQPLFIFLDDLQWADEASLQLLQFVAQYLPSTPNNVMLAATFRSEEADDNPALLTLLQDLGRLDHVHRLTLAPFSAEETEQLITTMWRDLPEGFRTPHMRDTLLQATGGNPLFMTEILQELTLADALPSDLPIPPSLVALIGRRLQQLPSHGRQVIESLAILDQPAHFELAQQISARSEEETITAVETGLRWRLLQTHQQFQIDFSHDLMRTAVIQQVSPIRQQRLHQRAALALAQNRAEAATIAYHWWQAGDEAQASQHALIAAQNATQLYAIDEAIGYYQRAIPHLTNEVEKLEAMRQLGRLYQRISEWDHAEQILEEGLAASVPDTTDAAHFQILLGQLYSRQSHYGQALAILQTAYQTCQRIEATDLLAHCVGTMGIIHYFQDAIAQSLACYQEALAIFEAQADEENIAIWLSNIATIYLYEKEYEQALAHLQQAVAVQERLGNQEQMAVGLGNLGDIYRAMGDYQQAITYHQKALLIRYEWGDRAGTATNLRDLGIDFAEVGVTDEALLCFWQALTLDIELARRDACGVVVGHIGCLLGQQGETTLGLRGLETAVSLLRLTHSRLFLGQFLLAQIDLLWPSANWAQIEALLAEATALLPQSDAADLLLSAQLFAVRLQVAQQQRSPAEARATLLAYPTHDDQQQAAISYALWQIDPTQEDRQETAVRYQRLYQQSPQLEYRQRLLDLTAQAPPPPSSLPDPPRLISPLATELSPYLEQLQSFLAV